MQFIPQPEGYITPDGSGGFDYVYQFRDHLNSVRLSYMDADKNGSIDPATEIIEENSYYPFGLKMRGFNDNVSSLGNSVAQRYKFNGKEYDQSFNTLNTYDFGARNYDPALGRWMNLDPLAEQMRRHSPYNYAFDNPVFFIDPDGMAPMANDWIDNGDGTFTAEANDSAFTLAQDAGISTERANEIVQEQHGENYKGEDGEMKSNIDAGDKVDIGRKRGSLKLYPNSTNIVETDMAGRTGEITVTNYLTENSKIGLAMIGGLVELYSMKPGGTKSKVRTSSTSKTSKYDVNKSDNVKDVGTARKKYKSSLTKETDKLKSNQVEPSKKVEVTEKMRKQARKKAKKVLKDREKRQ